jgi:hypothetical protein
VKEHQYHVRSIDAASTHNAKMKAVGLDKGSGRNGILCHYCFMADPLLGLRLAVCQFFISNKNPNI